VQNVHTIAAKASALREELEEARRELESATSKISEMQSASLLDGIKTVGSFKLLTAALDMKPDGARALCDTVKAKYPDAVAVFATKADGKLGFVAAAGSEAVKLGAHAGNILKEISAICGGRGGGRPDSAMSGGQDFSKVPEALARVEEILKSI
jgi:alanyl-tRNA synthetase